MYLSAVSQWVAGQAWPLYETTIADGMTSSISMGMYCRIADGMTAQKWPFVAGEHSSLHRIGPAQSSDSAAGWSHSKVCALIPRNRRSGRHEATPRKTTLPLT